MFTASSADALGSLSQSFPTNDTSLVSGTIVELKTNGKNDVEKATISHTPQLLGVVAKDPLLTLGSGQHQAKVVVSGLTEALVSNINGDIKVGDKITASPIQGVGMKALNSTQIVGTAASDLADSSTTSKTITDKSGKPVKVKIGTIALQVNVSYYAAPGDKLNSFVPTFLSSVGDSIAGKSVSPLRILAGFCALLVGFVIAGIMLQAGIRSGLISLGRNPLAHDFLRRGMLDVLATSLGILLITALLFYLLLTL